MRTKIHKVKTTYQYYSFWLAAPNAPRSQWILHDVKIPATSPLHALYMICYFKGWNEKKPKKVPTLSDVWIAQVVRIVEYEKVCEKGCTVVQYRCVKRYRNPLST